MQETQVQYPGRGDPLEKEMATHSRILAWRIPWAEEPDGLQPMVSQESAILQNWHFILQGRVPSRTLEIK